MLAKARRAARGLLDEASVVQTPRARLFAGIPNALLGAVYYPALAVAVWIVPGPPVAFAVLAAVTAAALTSAVLAYSLLFVTKMPCPYCWTSHAVNWLLLVLCFALFESGILFPSHRLW
jgi:uncharacterized membrane protein